MNIWISLIVLYLVVTIFFAVKIFTVHAKKSNDLAETLDSIDKKYGCGTFGLFLIFWPVLIPLMILFLIFISLLNVLFHFIKGGK